MTKPFKLQHGLHKSLDLKSIANASFGGDFARATSVDSPQISALPSDFGSLRLLSMSAYSTNEFTLDEKVELLVNILQQILPDLQLPAYLVHLILVELKREPQWSDIALPRGRSLHACQIAFENMRKQHRNQPNPPRPQPLTTYQHIAPAPSTISRSFSEQNPMALGRGQPILQSWHVPRTTASPPVTNGESPTFTRHTGVMELASSEQQRKRGRPSKAEVAERDRQYAARGEVYVSKRRYKKPRTSLAPEGTDHPEEESSTPLLQTPTSRAAEPVQESSSGRRRKRQLRDDSPIETIHPSTEIQQSMTEPETEPSIAQSPSDRLLLSHRDRGSVGSSLSRPTQQESEPLEPGYFESGSVT